MKRALLVILILGLCCGLAGCMVGDPVLPLTQDMSGISAALNMNPYPMVQMQDANLQLTLHDENNQPVSGATVQFDLSKLNMSMPPYFLRAKENRDGVYRAQGSFYMPGDWQIRVDVFVGGAHRQFIYQLKVD